MLCRAQNYCYYEAYGSQSHCARAVVGPHGAAGVGLLRELGGGKAALCGDPEEFMEIAATPYAWLLTGRS